MSIAEDVFDDGSQDATAAIHFAEVREMVFRVKAGETKRVWTGWEDRCSLVFFEVENGEKLLLDNLVYRVE
jgi:hypothetical protein